MPDLERSVWRLEAQVENLAAVIVELKTKLETVEEKLTVLDRWKGGMAALLIASAAVGFMIDKVIALFANK